MKYLLLGDDYKTLYVETDDQVASLRYDKSQNKWVPGGTALFDNRVGFDPSEPEDSIYRYGNTDCMKEIKEISKEEAEAFISTAIDDNHLREMLWILYNKY